MPGRRATSVGCVDLSTPSVPSTPDRGWNLPGLVDIHNHGGGGASFASGDVAENARGVDEHVRHGTTRVVASLVTDSPSRLVAAVAAAADSVDAGDLAGIHLEGPFLARLRCGAQDPRHLLLPDLELTREILDAGRGHVRVMTIAPELPGAEALIGLLLDQGVVPAVGHTEAEPGVVRRTLSATRTALGRPGLVTHLFNAMPAFHHRAPGAVGGSLAAAAAGDAYVEVIADGVHVDDETTRMVFELLGPDRVVLVTDAMAATGMPDGHYDLGPQRVEVVDGVARLGAAGPQAAAPLAGGTSHLLDVVRRCVLAGIALTDAVTAATRTPVAALGLDPPLGAPTGGGADDLLVTDLELHPLHVRRSGEWVSRSRPAGEEIQPFAGHAVPWETR